MRKKQRNRWNRKLVMAVALTIAAWLPVSSAGMLVNAEEVSPERVNQEEGNLEEGNPAGLGLGEMNLEEMDPVGTNMGEIGLVGSNLLGMNLDFLGMNPEEGASEEGIPEDGIAARAEDGSNIAATGTSGDNVTWVLTDDGMLTISGTGALLDGRGWLSYRDANGILRNSVIKRIVIEEGITSIGDSVFYYRRDISEIIIPNSVTSIGEYAFGYCNNLTRIDIPEGVTSIGEHAFGGCINLTEITLPNSLSGIGYRAFAGCSGLTSIVLPDSLTSLGTGAFADCSSLEKITLSNNLTEIPFWMCEGCSNLAEIVIPDGITGISSFAFEGCSSLAKVTIPNSVSYIGDYAFRSCKSLTSIHIPGNSESLWIDAGAFEGCSSLLSVTFPDNLWGAWMRIGCNAFQGCERLEKIVIPESMIMSVEGGAFADCTSLKEIYFEGDAPEFSNQREDGSGTMEPLEPFYNVTANVYYPGSNTTWTSANMLNYGGNLTWIAEGQGQPDSQPTSLQIVPEVTDEVYVIGSAAGAVIKCTGELKDFVSIAIDDVVLAPSDYTAVSGSTVVTILSSYLDKLSVGRHKVTLKYTYGSVDTTLLVLDRKTGGGTISDILTANGTNLSDFGSQNAGDNTGTAAGNKNSNQKAPKTGEETNIPWILAVMAFCIGSLCSTKYQNRKIRS